MSISRLSGSSRSPEDVNLLQAQLESIFNEKPKDETDLFETNVCETLKVVSTVKLMKFSRDQSIEQIQSSVFRNLERLYVIQREFPEVFEQRNYGELVEKLKQVRQEYGMEYIQDLPSQDYKINRRVDEFQGARLVLGCGRAQERGCGGHDLNQDYLVTIDQKSDPDLCANYHSSEFWNEFPDAKFEEVFFEGFVPDPDMSSLKQVARILRPGGIVRTECDTMQYISQANPEVFEKYLKACGFSTFEIRPETFHTRGSVSEMQILVLTK